MSYPIVGGEGSVSVQAGDSFYSNLFSLMTIQSSTLSISSEVRDVTPLSTSFAKTLTGLRSWAMQINGFLYAVPRLGNAALVASTGPVFYVTNPRSWQLTIEPFAVHDITTDRVLVGDTIPTWRIFRADNIVMARGAYTCLHDSATPIRTGASGTEPIQAPSITDDTSGTDLTQFTFTYGDSATDESIAFEAAVTGYPVPITRGVKNESVFGVVSSSTITAAGTNSIFGSGSIAAPISTTNGSTSTALQLRMSTLGSTRYFEVDTANGGDAFWRRITIGPVEPGEPVAITMEIQGSGPIKSV